MKLGNPAVLAAVKNMSTTASSNSASSINVLKDLRQAVNAAFKEGIKPDQLVKIHKLTWEGADRIIRNQSGAVNSETLEALKLKKFMNTLLEASPYLREDIAIQKSHRPSLTAIFNPQFLGEMKGRVALRIKDEPVIGNSMLPSELAKLDIADNIQKEASKNPKNYKKLTVEHVIALTGYAHQKLNLFGVLNMANRMQGMPDVKAFFNPFHQIVNEALSGLHGNPNFHKSGMQVYKGIRTLNNHEEGSILAHYKHLKDNKIAFTTPHIMSTTTDELKSYSYRQNHDIELRIANASVYDVRLFNHPTTAHEREALIPEGARLRTKDITQREVIRGEERFPTAVWVVEMEQHFDPIAHRHEQEKAGLDLQHRTAERGRIMIEKQK